MSAAVRIGSTIPILAVAVSAAAIVWAAGPLFQSGFPAGHDMPAHLTYSYLFDRAAAQGQFPVRWVALVQDGYSQPLFNFYQPGLYYLVQLVHLVVPSLSWSLKLTVVLLWWVGSGFMFLLCRPAGVLPATLAALLYALSPYVILDVFVRAAYPELAAIACAPGVLWSLARFLTTGRWLCLPVFAFLTFAILICHLPSALIFSPLFAGSILFFVFTKQTTLRRALMLAPPVLVGLGMAAFYIVPALGELHLVNIGALTTDYFDYRRHFVHPSQWVRYSWGYRGSVAGLADGMSFQIGIGQWVVIAVAIGSIIGSVIRNRNQDAVLLTFWLAIVGLAMFLMTESSGTVWEFVAPLAFVQFPWRFLMLIAVAGGALGAALLSSVKSRPAQALVVVGAVALQVWLSADYLGHRRYISQERVDIDDPEWAESPQAQARAFVAKGYYPVDVDKIRQPPRGRWTVRRGEAMVREIDVKDHALILDVWTDGGAQLTINSHFFPGWKVWRNGRALKVTRLPGSGYLLIKIPPGQHRLEAAFTDTTTRRLANLLSLGGFGAFALLLGTSVRRRRSVV